MVNPTDSDDSLAGQTGAFAAAASRRLPVWAALVLSGALIVLSGLLLYLSRTDVASAIASFSAEAPPPAAAAAPTVPVPAAGEPAPPEQPPELTALEVEAKLAPLPAEIEALVAEGRTELPEFAQRGPRARNPTEAQIMESRWQAWGRTWRNRLRLIRQKLPSKADCERYPELGASCFQLKVVFGLLDSTADQPSSGEARLYLDDAEAVLRVLPLLRMPPPESETETTAPGDAASAEKVGT